MKQITIPTPDGFNALGPAEVARLEASLSDLVTKAVQRHASQPATRSVMELAGCFTYHGPVAGPDDARAAAQKHVVDHYRESQS